MEQNASAVSKANSCNSANANISHLFEPNCSPTANKDK